jgi:hypothetical protein
MNRKRWAIAAAVLLVLIAVAAVAKGSGMAGLSSPLGRQGFAFDAAYADPDPMVLVVRYGDSSSCPSMTVRHAVGGAPDKIVVTLTREPMPADKPCTSDYGARLVRVSLTAPVGRRAVIDGSRQTPVPMSTGIPRFG